MVKRPEGFHFQNFSHKVYVDSRVTCIGIDPETMELQKQDFEQHDG